MVYGILLDLLELDLYEAILASPEQNLIKPVFPL